MDYMAKLHELIDKNKGMVLTKEASTYGIPRQYLKLAVESGILERVSQGVYLVPGEFEDKMYLLQACISQAIYSHTTAAYLHDLTDRDPLFLTVTLPRGYNGSSLRKDGVRVFTAKKELYDIGITIAKTSFDRDIKVYDAERTLCDLINVRSKTDIAIITDAVKRYTNFKDKNIPKLMRYAEMFGVTEKLRSYLEVLL